jgi:molecular chaperone GrpE
MAEPDIPDETSEESGSEYAPNSDEGGTDYSDDALRLQLARTQELTAGLRDQLLRKAAEFENYKRRSEADIVTIIRNANEGLLLALLPVVDDVGRSLQAGKETQNSEALYAGVEMIRSKFMKMLEKHGVTPFESAGKPFDVNFHDALLQVPRSDVPPRTVIQEVEPGYMLNDKVLRHAKVIVSTSPTGPETPNGQA